MVDGKNGWMITSSASVRMEGGREGGMWIVLVGMWEVVVEGEKQEYILRISKRRKNVTSSVLFPSCLGYS